MVQKKSNRLELILGEINRKGYLSINDLSSNLKVSKSTIKRDLLYLSDNGLISKTHGGAKQRYDDHELRLRLPVYGERQDVHKSEKNQIGRIAASFISDGDVIFLDAGTTIHFIPQHILEKKVEVYTNSISILLSSLEMKPNYSLKILDGIIDFDHLIITGIEQMETIKNIHFDRAFIGCESITTDHGIMVSTSTRRMFINQISNNSEQVILCADSSKLSAIDNYFALSFNQIDYFITDGNITTEQRNAIESAGTKVLTEQRMKSD